MRGRSAMDLNLVIIGGRVAVEPEVRTLESGVTLLRLLVTVRSTEPRQRIDVIPVLQWNPDTDALPEAPLRGRNVLVAGMLQRRFWSAEMGRLSKIEIIAHEISFRDDALLLEEQSSAVLS